jgi:hypothetical protein
MLMRKGPYFRTSRLDYAEIGCPRAAASALADARWLDGAPTLEFEALAPLVTKAELQALGVRLGMAVEPRATRAATLEALRAAAPEPRTWLDWFPASPDTVLLFAIAPLCERLRLMFFGNLHQDWSEFVLADLGIYRYESVPIDRASRAFQRREDIDAWLALRDCRDTLDAAAISADFDAAVAIATTLATLDGLAPRTQGNPWLRARHDKLRHAVGLAAERAGAPELAWRAYLDCGHAESRYRRVRVLEQLDRRDEALALAQQIANAPANEEEAQRAARTLGRLARTRAKSKASASNAPGADGFAQRELMLPAGPVNLRVEEAARLSLATPDAPAFYVENTLINALFGLLCWPALFAPLPGAFFHPFQRGPADLHAADFVARRASQFEACLAELETRAYRETILRRYAEKTGIQSPFVAWPALSEELLALALECFPAAHLRLWFERLLREPVANRSGLPDLVRFWPLERRYELIEVKGPGDRLQDNQRRWLAYCVTHGMPVSVLQVRWANQVDDKTSDEANDKAAAQALREP